MRVGNTSRFPRTECSIGALLRPRAELLERRHRVGVVGVHRERLSKTVDGHRLIADLGVCLAKTIERVPAICMEFGVQTQDSD